MESVEEYLEASKFRFEAVQVAGAASALTGTVPPELA